MRRYSKTLHSKYSAVAVVSRIEVCVTLILNILHKDMSVLAADKKAKAEWTMSPVAFSTVPPGKGHMVHNFNKVTMNSSKTLALGIAGLIPDHCYTQEIERSDNIDDGLRVIRKHIEGFVPIFDRGSLSTLTEFMRNEGIATFFDQSLGSYFTYKYIFSPVEFHARLHRGAGEVKILYAGSGIKYFEGEDGLADIAKFKSSAKNACSPEDCISWMKDVYKRVGERDPEIGDEPNFLVSNKTNFGYGTFEPG
jgi:hypothetical protein